MWNASTQYKTMPLLITFFSHGDHLNALWEVIGWGWFWVSKWRCLQTGTQTSITLVWCCLPTAQCSGQSLILNPLKGWRQKLTKTRTPIIKLCPTWKLHNNLQVKSQHSKKTLNSRWLRWDMFLIFFLFPSVSQVSKLFFTMAQVSKLFSIILKPDSVLVLFWKSLMLVCFLSDPYRPP